MLNLEEGGISSLTASEFNLDFSDSTACKETETLIQHLGNVLFLEAFKTTERSGGLTFLYCSAQALGPFKGEWKLSSKCQIYYARVIQKGAQIRIANFS